MPDCLPPAARKSGESEKPLAGVARSEDHHAVFVDDCTDGIGRDGAAGELPLQLLHGHETSDTYPECSVLVRNRDRRRAFLSVEERRTLNNEVQEGVLHGR